MIETSLIISTILSNGAFIGVTAFFAKRWMDKTDKNTDQIYNYRKADAKTISDELKLVTREHQLDFKNTTDRLEANLNRIYDQIRIANGRTAKIEGGLETVRQVCAEKHKNDNGGK
jgi:cytochrome c556